MNRIDIKTPLASIDEDYARWCMQQGNLLRIGRLSQLDRNNLAEEIESLGRSEADEIESRLGVLLTHLLKWHFQPDGRSNSWKASIVEQRTRIARRIRRSPSLRDLPGEILAEEFSLARLAASGETAMPEESFPEVCPYSIEQVLDPTFFPGAG